MASTEIRQEVVIPASPSEVYELLLDSEKHEAFTGEPASVGRELGQDGSAYDGHLVFVNRELVPGRRIVQDWRAAWPEWPEDAWSRVTFEFVPDGEKTRITFTQSDVPESYVDDMAEGWHEHYWEPMTRYLEEQKGFS